MEKYSVLVWAEDAGAFAKECQSKGFPKEIERLFILGEELKICDFKLLNEVVPIPYVLDREIAKDKVFSEIFMLGRCAEYNEINGLSNGFITYKLCDKKTAEIAKTAGISILQWNQLFKNKSTTKKQETKPVKKKPITEEKPAETMEIPKKRTPKQSISPKEYSSLCEELASLIKDSTINSKTKEFYLSLERLKNLETVIKNASDENIGLPFQLQMYFGKDGELILGLLKKHFKKLKKIGES